MANVWLQGGSKYCCAPGHTSILKFRPHQYFAFWARVILILPNLINSISNPPVFHHFGLPQYVACVATNFRGGGLGPPHELRTTNMLFFYMPDHWARWERGAPGPGPPRSPRRIPRTPGPGHRRSHLRRRWTRSTDLGFK